MKNKIILTACVCINLILSTTLLTHYLKHKTDLKLAASLREVQERQIVKLTEQNEFLTMQNQLLGTALDESWEPLPITCDEDDEE